MRAPLVSLSLVLFACSNARPIPQEERPIPRVEAGLVAAVRAEFQVGSRPRLAALTPAEARALVPRGGRFVPEHGPSPLHAPPRPDVSLPSHADQSWSVTLGSITLEARLLGAKPVLGVVDDRSLVFADAMPGASLLLVPVHTGVEEYVRFASRPASSRLRYEIVPRGAAGLRLVDGVLELLDEGGAPRLRTTAPWIVDARGRQVRGALHVEGCAVDEDARPPWGRPVTPLDHATCTVVASWNDEGLAYPLLVDPGWTTTGVLAGKRHDHTATALGVTTPAACTAGCVLVAGGLNGETSLASAELYNAATGTWATVASLTSGGGVAVSQHGAFASLDTRIAIVGGRTGVSTATALIMVYDVATGVWSSPGSLAGGARYHPAVVTTPRTGIIEAMVIGGFGGTGGVSTAVDGISIKNTATTIPLTARPALSVVRQNPAAAATTIAGIPTFFAVGGVGLDTIDRLTLGDSSWTTLSAKLSVARSEIAAVSFDYDNVLFIGGRLTSTGGGTYSAVVDRFSKSAQAMSSPAFTATISAARPCAGVLVGTTTARALCAGVYNGNNYALPPARADFVFLDGRSLSMDFAANRRDLAVAPLPNGGAIAAGGFATYDGLNYTYPTFEEVYRPLSNGTACTAAAECESGLCVDGVCCDAACTEACKSCKVTGKVGTCSVVPAGAPTAPRTCTGYGTACGSACDGTSNACVFAPTSKTCGTASCSGASEVSAAPFCNGSGACLAPVKTSCIPYVCSASACKTGCSTNADCATGFKCSAGTCITTGELGAPCTAGTDCTTGHCVDKVCCTSAACGAGERCDLTGKGDCRLPFGSPCDSTTAARCPTGICTDGVCCDSTCAGQCEACDVSGAAGTCTAVVGAPHAPRGACAGSGACQGSCDGSNRSACASFPGSEKPCGTTTCRAEVESAVPVCDGKGACAPSTDGRTCAGYRCDATGTSCLTKCQTNDDCATSYSCDASQQCNPLKAKCSEDGTMTVPIDGSAPVSCAPFLCNRSTGDCYTTCKTTSDCATGAVCDGDKCVPAPTGETDDGGGCAFGARGSSGLWLLAFGLGVVGTLRRRRGTIAP